MDICKLFINFAAFFNKQSRLTIYLPQKFTVMKKLFSLFAVLVAAVAMNAATVEFDFSSAEAFGYTNPDAGKYAQVTSGSAITKDGVTITPTFASGNGVRFFANSNTGVISLRFYKTTDVVIAAPAGTKLTKVTAKGSNMTDKYISGDFVGGTWEGNSDKITFQVFTSTVIFDKLTVEYSGEASGVNNPVISADNKVFEDKATITITADEGCDIYYTTNGNDPDKASTKYAAPFNVTESCTIKAIAYKGEKASSISTLNVQKLQTATIAEALAAAENTVVAVSATVYAVCGQGAVLGDATGFMYYHNNSNELKTVGETITINGAVTKYNGFNQFTEAATITKVGTTTVTYPTPVALDGAAADAWIKKPAIQYVSLTGKLAKSGNYYNLTIPGAGTAIGSLVSPAGVDEFDGKDITVTGFALYCSSSKYLNIVITEAKSVASGTKTLNFTAVNVLADMGEDELSITLSNAAGDEFKFGPVDHKAWGTIAGTYNAAGASIKADGKTVKVTEGTLTITYVDCDANKRNTYTYTVSAYDAAKVLYESENTIATTILDDLDDEVFCEDDNVNINATSALAIASALKEGDTTAVYYNIFAYVSNIKTAYDASYKNITLYVNDDKNITSATGFYAFRAVVENVEVDKDIKVGDMVRIRSRIINYKGNTPETVSPATITIWTAAIPTLRGVEGPKATEITSAQAIEIGSKLADNVETEQLYRVTGYVTKAYEYSTQYNNQNWYMNDTATATHGEFYAFQCKPAETIVEGMKVAVTGHIVKFVGSKGTPTIQIKGGTAEILERPTTVGIRNTRDEEKAAKLLINGRVVIRRAGNEYNVVGQKL